MKPPHPFGNTRKLGERPGTPPSGDFMARLPAEVLSYLAADPVRLTRFFDITGLDVATLRKAAGTPGFESSLLDYLGSDEALLRDFSALHGYDPAQVDRARMILAGPHGPG